MEADMAGLTTLLPYPRQDQEQTQWCWAAVAASVVKYYDAQTSWTQCSIVNAELHRQDCCAAGSGDDCNKPSGLAGPLARVMCLYRWDIAQTSSYQVVQDEIASQRPLCVRIEWAGGGGHFAAIIGCLAVAGVDHVVLADPQFGYRQLPLADLVAKYPGADDTGKWTDSYFTRLVTI
jgi:hypothetical protein